MRSASSLGGAILPEFAPRLPIRAQAFVMPSRVLNNECVDALRMRQRHSKTDRTAIIVHVKRVTRQPERFRKVIHDLGDVIEGVGILFRVGPVAVSKARVVRRDEMKAIGQPREERFELPRGSWKTVQQEKRRRVFRTGLSIKDRRIHRSVSCDKKSGVPWRIPFH